MVWFGGGDFLLNTSPGLQQRSAAFKMRRLSALVKVRRRARATTSVSLPLATPVEAPIRANWLPASEPLLDGCSSYLPLYSVIYRGHVSQIILAQGGACAVTCGMGGTCARSLQTCRTWPASCCGVADAAAETRHQARNRLVAKRVPKRHRLVSHGVNRGIWNTSVACPDAAHRVLTAASNPSSRTTSTLSVL